MALVPNNPYNSRLLEDVNYIKAVTLPTSASAAMDLIQPNPYPTTERVIAQINVSLISASESTLTGSTVWQDSADNVTFANVSQLAGISTYGATGTIAAASQLVLFPPSVRRYVRVLSTYTYNSASVQVGVPDLTGSITASLLF
jgi:hypothetical protein